MRTIEFNLDTYKRIVSGELKGFVQTRRGTKVYVKRIDGEGEYPVIAQPEGSALFYTYTIDGRIRANNENEDDLVIKLKDKVMEQKLVRVPFDVEMAKKITNGEVEGRIVTRDGRGVRVVCFDMKSEDCIVAIIQDELDEHVYPYPKDGCIIYNRPGDSDLMIEIPEYMMFKKGDVIVFGNNKDNLVIGIFKKQDSATSHECYVMTSNYGVLTFDAKPLTYDNARFATEAEKQKLIDILKTSDEAEAKECLKILGIEQKAECEFKPFDKVLVRDGNDGCWHADIFSHKNKDRGRYYCTGYEWRQCIPYNEQTAHLLGTTENWEE